MRRKQLTLFIGTWIQGEIQDGKLHSVQTFPPHMSRSVYQSACTNSKKGVRFVIAVRGNL